MLAATKPLLQKAQKKKYAVAHFNVSNMEILQGVLKAADKLRAPIIIATSESAIKYAGIDFLHSLAVTASKRSKVPVALHLDHGRDLDIIRKCIRIGYSSVMIDASHKDFQQNIRLTKKIVNWAHKKGVSVEAELGTIGGKEDTIEAKKIIYTNPDSAREFVQRTGCDFLAVAIGTSHGAYKFKGRASLRMDILKEIRKQVKVPLVLHGASRVPHNVVRLAEKYGAQLKGVQGVPTSQVKLAIREGITKINTDTDLRIAFDAAIRKFLAKKPKDFNPRNILKPTRELITKVAEERIKLFGSVGKA